MKKTADFVKRSRKKPHRFHQKIAEKRRISSKDPEKNPSNISKDLGGEKRQISSKDLKNLADFIERSWGNGRLC